MQEYLTQLNQNDFDIFQQIESQRTIIREEAINVDVMDFGAGNPNDNRSPKQMYNGVHKKVTTHELCRIGLKENYAALLYSLIKYNKPKIVLELGTCCAFSSIYMAKASKYSQIHTIEGSKNTAKIALKNIHALECDNIHLYIGRFMDTLPELLKQLRSIDFAFIDGHHDKEATLEYFNIIKPYLSNKATILFDDISWSTGMQEAWQIIKQDDSIDSYKDFSKLGLVTMKSLT